MDNDRHIMKLFNECDNEKLSKLNRWDINDFLYYLDKYYLDYRNILNISSDITFGLEIELEYFKGSFYDLFPFEKEIYKIVGSKEWNVKNDITLTSGREINTDICVDNKKTWINLDKVCDFSSKYLEVGPRSAGHVNIGSQILGNNTLYWYRLLKLWGIYENVIYRFSYGEYLSYFPFMKNSSKPVGDVIIDRLELNKKYIDDDVSKFICFAFSRYREPGFLKKNGISFYKMLGENDFSKMAKDLVIEFRVPLSSCDPIVWQNYVNFFVHLLLYCKSADFNDDILDRRLKKVIDIVGIIDNYDEIYLDQALELCDLIFDKNIDKIYFLKQYLKGFEESKVKYKKSKKFTMNV